MEPNDNTPAGADAADPSQSLQTQPGGQRGQGGSCRQGRKSGMRKTFAWLGAAVVLTAAGVATGGAMAHPMGGHAMTDGSTMGMAMPMHGGGGSMGGPMGGMWMGRGIDRMLDSVNASDAQRTQVKQIAEAARADLQAQRESGRALRDRAMSAFTQPNVDAREVETVRQQMLAQHDAASKRMSQAMLDISRVLTPEQRTQLAQRMKQRGEQMRQRMEERQRPGAPTT